MTLTGDDELAAGTRGMTKSGPGQRARPPSGRGLLPSGVASPADLSEQLRNIGYLPDEGLAMACVLALRLHRPLFLEGEPGVGKTELALTLARLLDAPLIRLQCYEGIDANQAIYDWDFPRQLLHLRAAEAAAAWGGQAGVHHDTASLEADLYDRRFLIARPLLQALETSPSVLLIDEIDRADDEFEAFLLEMLNDSSVSIPELGTVRAEVPPVIVITSNRTREVHDALKRRCLYHWLDHPDFAREVAIVRSRVPEASEALASQVVTAVQRLREERLVKPPGVAETLDWTEALVAVGTQALNPDIATATLGALLKYREDHERVARLETSWVPEAPS